MHVNTLFQERSSYRSSEAHNLKEPASYRYGERDCHAEGYADYTGATCVSA